MWEDVLALINYSRSLAWYESFTFPCCYKWFATTIYKYDSKLNYTNPCFWYYDECSLTSLSCSLILAGVGSKLGIWSLASLKIFSIYEYDSISGKGINFAAHQNFKKINGFEIKRLKLYVEDELVLNQSFEILLYI